MRYTHGNYLITLSAVGSAGAFLVLYTRYSLSCSRERPQNLPVSFLLLEGTSQI